MGHETSANARRSWQLAWAAWRLLRFGSMSIFQKIVKNTHATLAVAGTTVSEVALAGIINDKKIMVTSKKQKILARLSKIEKWEKSYDAEIRNHLHGTILVIQSPFYHQPVSSGGSASALGFELRFSSRLLRVARMLS